jgi:uncharacterized protein YecE (DUF72 family)
LSRPFGFGFTFASHFTFAFHSPRWNSLCIFTSMVRFHVGCSGFYYNHWKPDFYPEDLPKSKWFAYYCQHYNTLELNVTFYRFPKITTFESWYNKTPADFVFAVKAPRLITHYKQFNDTAEMMQGYYETMLEGLKEKLGTVLFQLPPRSAYTEDRLERILQTMDSRFNNVLEFRHPSWWNEGVYRLLSKHKICFCGMSHPDLPDEIIQNSPIVYYRLHGVPELYKSPYTLDQLKSIVNEIDSNKKTRHAYIYFNNDIGGSAVRNATEMIAYLKSMKSKTQKKGAKLPG